MKENEIQERKHLEKVKGYLKNVSIYLEEKILRYDSEIKEDVVEYGEKRYDMDHIEKICMRQVIESKITSAEQAVVYKKRIDTLTQSPYFGRFDFQARGASKEEKCYVGIHHFFYNEEKRPVIYDWRAPISSLFYDDELGPAEYQSPSGTISGDVRLKRQFRIRNGEMEFMLESSLNITDDILQQELSRTSDDGMKNIVATIQRDQNAIIRNEQSNTLIIQGVAGSGKTSIALHRIAFLLYHFAGTITSNDILIISPNRVFADYISNVLPELGEETVGEIQMETLASELLGHRYPFETFFEQTTGLMENHDAARQHRIQEKSSSHFLRRLDEYIAHIKAHRFTGKDIMVSGRFVPGWIFDEVFETFCAYAKEECVSHMTNIIVKKIENEYRTTLTSVERSKVKKSIKDMHQDTSLREMYVQFFAWIGEPDLFQKRKDDKLEYADAFPMSYLKLCLEGRSVVPRDVKHLLIDEMQDYTAVQYAVISKLFPCHKTILGDVNQSVNPYSASSTAAIQDAFPEALYVTLNKSYRSSYEIMQFVQRISPNPDLELIERHGEPPQVFTCKAEAEERRQITDLAQTFLNSSYNTCGIICKTQNQAVRLFEELQAIQIPAHLLTTESTTFYEGIVVCTAHMAKGLEFDQVIIPEVTDKNYHTEMDKNLLYVACTRAMHKLFLTHAGTRTRHIAV